MRRYEWLDFWEDEDDKLSYGMFGLNKWKEKREECKEIREKNELHVKPINENEIDHFFPSGSLPTLSFPFIFSSLISSNQTYA